MDNKIIIEVFGLRYEGVNGGSCGSGCGSDCDSGCGGSCVPAPTMGEIYQAFAEFMEASDVKDRIIMRFIDINEDDVEITDSVKKALEKGLDLPVTAINGKAEFYGGLSMEIYEAVKQM